MPHSLQLEIILEVCSDTLDFMDILAGIIP